MVKAIDLCDSSLQIRLIIARSARAALLTEYKALDGWSHTDYLGKIPPSEVAQVVRRATVGIVVLHPIRNYTDSYPTKLFEYMAACLPVVASNFERWRSIVEDLSCGILVNPLDAAEIAKAIEWMVRHPDEARAMGERGRARVEALDNWESQGK